MSTETESKSELLPGKDAAFRFNPGERVWWKWTTRGGYGLAYRNAAIVVSTTKTGRVRIACDNGLHRCVRAMSLERQ